MLQAAHLTTGAGPPSPKHNDPAATIRKIVLGLSILSSEFLFACLMEQLYHSGVRDAVSDGFQTGAERTPVSAFAIVQTSY